MAASDGLAKQINKAKLTSVEPKGYCYQVQRIVKRFIPLLSYCAFQENYCIRTGTKNPPLQVHLGNLHWGLC